MKRPIKFVGLALCSLSITMAGNALATAPEETSGFPEEQAAGSDVEAKDCHLFFVKNNLGLQQASMDAGDPINTLHFFVTGTDGRIIKNAQVITNLIDEAGNQQLTRALPFKGGYLLALDHLAAGAYLAETEIITRGRFLSETFRFNKS